MPFAIKTDKSDLDSCCSNQHSGTQGFFTLHNIKQRKEEGTTLFFVFLHVK